MQYSGDPFAGRRAIPQGVPRRFVKQRAPTSADTNVSVGDFWFDSLAKNGYVCLANTGGVASWAGVGTGSAPVEIQSDFISGVLDRVAVGAATTTQGNRYIADSTGGGWTAEYVYTYLSGAWEEFIPTTGCMCYEQDAAEFQYFTAGAWATFPTAPAASTTVAGIVERATNAEIVGGVDDARYITPKGFADNLSVTADATESSKGIVEQATNAEVTTGTADTYFTVSPLKLKTHLSSPNPIGDVAPNTGAFTTLSATTPLPISSGGTGKATWTSDTFLVGNGTSVPNEIANGTDGQIIIASTGASPAFASLTAGEAIDITEAAGSITILCEDASATNKGVAEFATDAETTTGTAIDKMVQPANLEVRLGTQTQYGLISGGGGAGTNLGIIAPGTNGQICLGSTGAAAAFATPGSSDSTIAWTLGANTLTAQARAATSSVTGVIEIATDAETTTGTATDRCITPANLEVRLGTQTQYGVMLGGGAAGSNLSVAAAGTNGQVLVGSTGADPAMATIGGLTGLTATVGAGTLSLEVDESYVRTADVTVSAAEIVLLMSAPKELVAAPAAGKAIQFLGAIISNDYATAAYNAPTAAGDDLAIIYAGGGQASATLESTGFINAGSDLTKQMVPSDLGPTVSLATALQLDNIGANEYVNPGAAAGELKVRVMYRIVTTGL